MSSALILGPSDGMGAALDGRITAEQILNTWTLDADLVVLSACETGVGKRAGGEGYLGFAQALFMKGARNLVLSDGPSRRRHVAADGPVLPGPARQAAGTLRADAQGRGPGRGQAMAAEPLRARRRPSSTAWANRPPSRTRPCPRPPMYAPSTTRDSGPRSSWSEILTTTCAETVAGPCRVASSYEREPIIVFLLFIALYFWFSPGRLRGRPFLMITEA